MSTPKIMLETARPPQQAMNPTDYFWRMLRPDLDPVAFLVRDGLTQPQTSVLRQFALWQRFQPEPILVPDLSAYRDYLLDVRGCKASTVQGELSVIRKRYREILRDRDLLFGLVVNETDWLHVKAIVDELVTRTENAIDRQVAPVRLLKHQDKPDGRQFRLSVEESQALLCAPGVADLMQLRDTGIIALLMCTGIRSAELVALDVSDLRQSLTGEPALHVREGKGMKSRLVPYGDMGWCLDIVEHWLAEAGIQSGPVFRGLRYRSTLGAYALLKNSRGLSNAMPTSILKRYPIQIVGQAAPVVIRAHDLRRTYALRCYAAGMDVERIRLNLGHTSSATTLEYIGSLGGLMRRPPSAYNRPESLLSQIESEGTST